MKINIEDLLETTIKIGMEFEETIYDRGDGGHGDCLYVQHGKPGCIVGQALFKLGVPLARMTEYDTYGDDSGINQIIGGDTFSDDFVSNRSYEKTAEIVAKLQMIQRHQDDGATWGEAVNTVK